MKLTSFTDYSLRVLIYLAARPDVRSTVGEIAEAFDISAHHLTKVVHLLGKHGWLSNVRGKGGGMELARPPEEISIGAVVRLTEGEPRPAECFGALDTPCRIEPACRLRGVLAEAADAFYGVLDRYTLADLMKNRKAVAQLLFFEERPITLRR